MTDSTGMNARDAACRFLTRSLDKRLGERRRQLAQQVAHRDRALFQELVAGTTRREVTLDAILRAFSRAPLQRIEGRLKAILRVAIYQIVYLERIPDYSAVDEALKLIPSKKARGFANGILRQLLRDCRHQHDQEMEGRHPSRGALQVDSHRWFVSRRPFLPDPLKNKVAHHAVSFGFTKEGAQILVDALGEATALEVMAQGDDRPQGAMRLRGNQNEDREILKALKESGAELTAIPQGDGRHFGLPKGMDPASIPGFADGKVTVQGPFAAQVAPLLAAEEVSSVLDLCAPPGGKTIHLAELLPQAQITAFAQDENGRIRLNRTLKRCPCPTVSLVSAPSDPFQHGPFDAMLLDVPCSNTGVLSRRPEARHRLNRPTLASLAKIQREILRLALSKAVQTSDMSRLVYSTCSILPEENGTLVRQILEEFPRATMARELESLPQGPWQDGGYAALVLIRPGA